jgi:hypothetical protein
MHNTTAQQPQTVSCACEGNIQKRLEIPTFSHMTRLSLVRVSSTSLTLCEIMPFCLGNCFSSSFRVNTPCVSRK